MNKTAIKNFSVWARTKLIKDIKYKAGLIGITEKGIKEPLPQSANNIEFYDIGTKEPYSISGIAVNQRRSLVKKIKEKENDSDYETAYNFIMEEVAYTWFNRLIAVRFMEVNDYLPSRIRVLSSESGKLEPDLVSSPFQSDIEFTDDDKYTIMHLKDENKIDELFQILFIKQCNALNDILPKLFEKTNDYTELLLKLSIADKENSVVYHLVNDIPEEDFDVEKGGQVEIIGWLYQYYNTEPKEESYALLKKNVKVTKERIPSVTQLFTPDWIVRYMVENSLGRLWVEGHNNDDLKKEWKYYIDEAEQEESVKTQLEDIRKEYKNLKPEDIKIIDPCMGSGHILVYAFDVLMQIYESAGYGKREAVKSIIENNIYGIDIDDRAFQMSYFAVMMKARQYNRRILDGENSCNVYAFCESNGINKTHLQYFGSGLSDIERNDALNQITGLIDKFRDGKEYGSILDIENYNWDLLKKFVLESDIKGQLSLETFGIEETEKMLLDIIELGKVMAQKYHIVVTNPPYMGSSGMNSKLSEYLKKNYSDSKSDLFAVFIEKSLKFGKANSFIGMITQHSFMFLSSYEKLRQKLVNKDFVNMAHLGARAFDEIGGEVVQTTSFVIRNNNLKEYKGVYCRLIEPTSENGKKELFLSEENRFTAKQENFSKIPGSPIAYWASEKEIKSFSYSLLSNNVNCKSGIMTGDEKYIKLWFEPNIKKIKFDCNSAEDMGNSKWFPLNSGGGYRKWYGNNEKIVDLWNNGFNIRKNVINFRLREKSLYFKRGLTWGRITSSKIAFREVIKGSLFGDAGPIAFVEKNRKYILGFLCSKVINNLLSIINPTLNFQISDIMNVPLILDKKCDYIEKIVSENISISKTDWDSFETSWDFKKHPLVAEINKSINKPVLISDCFKNWENQCNERFNQLKSNEEELNRIFIEIYGLQDELTPDVEDKDVTVRKADLKRDIKSLLSYAVGCMFGRYSPLKDGLLFAGGQWDYNKIGEELFNAIGKNDFTSGNMIFSGNLISKDNIIPITDEEYIENDIVTLLCEWLKSVFGEETLDKNIEFIANALGNSGKTPLEIIRNYFIKDFFKDHCKIYQKRPIYWLFDSGKQNGFKALIYLHRYNADTIGNVRIDYLHRIQRVYESEINRMQENIENGTNSRQIALDTKRKEKLIKQLKECRDYDENISHLALSRIELDLDDGVKVNYEKLQTASDGKFYNVLAKI